MLNVNKSVRETLINEFDYLKKINEPLYLDGYDRMIRKDGLCGTITTRISASNNSYIIFRDEKINKQCLLIKENTKKGYAEAYDGDGVYIRRPHQKRGCVQKGMIQTIKANCDDIGVVVKETRNE